MSNNETIVTKDKASQVIKEVTTTELLNELLEGFKKDAIKGKKNSFMSKLYVMAIENALLSVDAVDSLEHQNSKLRETISDLNTKLYNRGG